MFKINSCKDSTTQAAISKESISAVLDSKKEEIKENEYTKEGYYHKSIVVESFRNNVVLATFFNEDAFTYFKDSLKTESNDVDKHYICKDFVIVKTPEDLDKLGSCAEFIEGRDFKLKDLEKFGLQFHDFLIVS